MAERKSYSFRDKKYSSNAIASVVLGLIAFLLFVLLLFYSFLMKGQADAWVGACGVTGIVMALLGLWYGFASFRDDCKGYFLSRLGTIISTVSVVGWFFIVCVGLVVLYF